MMLNGPLAITVLFFTIGDPNIHLKWKSGIAVLVLCFLPSSVVLLSTQAATHTQTIRCTHFS